MMKEARKSILIAALIGLSNLITAQAVVNNSLVPAALQEAEIGIQVPTPLVGLMMPNFQATNENVLFYEDFANGFDGNNGVGAWTAEDSGEGLIWQHVNQAGNGYYADGTASGVQPPAGEFSTNIGSLNSTTAANGWMIFDNDFYNTPIADGYEDTFGWMTSPSLDFTDVGFVVVTWEQYFRYCCYPYAPIYLQASNDGGANWTTFDAHGTFIESANAASANALTTSVDISCVAANSANVQIRFSYLQPPETGDAYSHYHWGIDDVTISENPVENDLTAVQLTNGDINEGWEYRVTPLEQAITEADGGLLAGFLYRNSGNSDQDETTVTIEVLDEGGNVLSTTIEYIGTVNSSGNPLNCPTNPQDTIYVATGWTPTATGNYVLQATIASANEDENPEDNTLSKVIIYSDYEYGHDDQASLDVEFAPGDSEIAGLFNPCGYGNYYTMANEGSVAFGLAVRFGPNSGGGDLEFETRLYENDGSGALVDAPFESAYWTYDDAWTPDSAASSEVVYLLFEDPIELGTENAYFAAVINEFESEGQLTVLGNADSDTDNSTGDYNQTGGGDFVWFTSQTSTPAIRLIMAPELFVISGCENSDACNYDPNANEDDGSCEFNSCLDCDLNYNFESEDWAYYPDPEEGQSFTDATVNSFYEDAFHVLVPTDAASIDPLFALPLDSMIFQGAYAIANLSEEYLELSELGLSMVCNNGGTLANNCAFASGTQNCMNFVGTPTVDGEFSISISILAYVTVFGVPVAQPYEIAGIPLQILPQEMDGCTEPSACNYNPNVAEDDGSCTYPGCLDSTASNYDAGAGCDGDCFYLSYDCASIGDEAWVDEVMGLFPEWQDAMHGVAWEGEWVFNIPATVIEPGSGVSYGLHHVEWTEISGIPSWATTDYTLTDLEASSQHCIASSGTPTEPGMHEIVVSGEVFISVFGQPFSIGEQTFSAWLEVLENPNPIPGCTYANAVNFVVYATADDGSCLFGGCTDEAANNFNPIATIDDGSCGEECEPGVDSSCSTDANNDGAVNVTDLLLLLGEFGLECE